MSMPEAVGIGLICAVCALVLREAKSPLSPFIPLIGGLLLLGLTLPYFEELLSLAELLSDTVGTRTVEAVSRVLAVGLVASLGADACAELGASGIADKLELCGKLEILLLCVPTLRSLLSSAMELLS